MTSNLIDQPTRDAIRVDLGTTIMVEAGAGSGKTYSLVERIVALLEQGESTINRIAAITFTRKAADELKQKVQEVLEERARKLPAGVEKDRLDQALLDLERGFISTIHSFCERLLREQPVAARLDPEFETIEDGEEGPLADQVWQEYLLDRHLNDPDAILTLEEAGVTLDDLKAAYDTLRLYPDVQFPHRLTAWPDATTPLAELDTFLAHVDALIPRPPNEGRYDKLQDAILQALQFRRNYDLQEKRNFAKLFALLDKGYAITQKLWHCKEDALEARDSFQRFREETVSLVTQAVQEYRHGLVMPFVLPAVAMLGERREALSRLNFQDLLMRTAAALRDNPGMRRYLQGRFTHLLVDEFQDTDPIQAEVMLYLTGRDCDEKDWRKLVPRPGSLFVVGDPKQSIYRFRRADIDTYNLVKKLITDSGGRLLHLDTNFRSQSWLAEFINPVFEYAFPEDPTAVQAAYAPMHTIREPAPGTLAGVYQITIPKVYRNNQRGIAQTEATRLATWIRWALDQELLLNRSKDKPPTPICPDDILILLRYKGELSIYARALEEQGIPYSISGGSGLKHSTVLAEAHQLLTVLERPDDPVNLVGALRGPFFGFNDQELLDYRDAGGYFSIFASVPDTELDADTAAAFTDALEKLRHYYRWSRTLPPATAVRKIFEDIGILGWIAAEPAGLSGAANVLLVRELLAATESGGETTFGGLVRKQGELLETGADNELDIYAGSRSAVRLMNLHRAKGLEAPVVCLAHPGRSVSKDPILHVDRTTDHPQGHLQICQHSPFGGAGPVVATPPDWNELQAREKEYEDAEELRLVYVGATRAKDVLIVSRYPDKPEASPWKVLNAALADIPELPAPEPEDVADYAVQIGATAGDASQSMSVPESPEVTATEYETFCTALPATWDAGRKPSYATILVTEMAKEAQAPKRHTTGKGVSWGNVVHRMLEKLLRSGKDLDTCAVRILVEEGRPAAEAAELTNLLHEIQKTSFWQRVKSAHERLPEVPLGGLLNAVSPTGETLSTATQGIIDLAFREDAGWVLVDFKTDYYETEAERIALVDYYAAQLKLYAELWKLTTGEAPTELGLLFTHKKDCVLL